MATIKDVTGTAFVVAEFRNDENKESRPLYRDPYVHLFLDEGTALAANRISEAFPAIRTNVRLRTRYLDDWLERRLRQGCRQVIILGAGLDTRPQRMASTGAVFFEIDCFETQALKKARLRENGVGSNTIFIAANYITEGIIPLLQTKGFSPALSTHVIWEGNTMYLSEKAVQQVLNELKGNIPNCTLSFDYLTQGVIDNKTGDTDIKNVVERFAAMGAPWTYGIDDIEQLARECGVTLLDRNKLSQLHRLYWPDRELASPLQDFYELCTVSTR